MYCLQWLIPVLLLPKPVNPAFLYNHAMFVILYLLGFVLERRPCAICSLVFAAAVFLICYSWSSHCIVWPCEPSEVSSPISGHWCSITDDICKHTKLLVVKECLNMQLRWCYCYWLCSDVVYYDVRFMNACPRTTLCLSKKRPRTFFTVTRAGIVGF